MKNLMLVTLIGSSMGYAATQNTIQGERLLVAIEDGATVELNAKTGAQLAQFATGANAFGALYSRDGRKSYVTDKSSGVLSQIDVASGAITHTLQVGTTPQQPVITSDNRIYIPLSGEAAIALVKASDAGLELVKKIATGDGTKPHILSLSPDEKMLYSTVQGKDPKILAIDIQSEPEVLLKEVRYDLVPRVLAATNAGAFYTAHHSTGLHFANLADGKASTPFMDKFGSFSEARKQIEGVAVNADGSLIGLTHEGRRALIVVKEKNAKLMKSCHIAPLAANPYWVTLDSSEKVAFVSIPEAGVVEAYDIEKCSAKPLWSANVGGKAKRMSVMN